MAQEPTGRLGRNINYSLMLCTLSWERQHPAGLPPEMAALPVRNISYSLTQGVTYQGKGGGVLCSLVHH